MENGYLTKLAGITGLGWTTSFLGFLSTIVVSGNTVVTRLIADPYSLLYVGTAFFIVTLGLDRLTNSSSGDD